VARPRARPDQQQLVNIEEDVAIFLGAMQSEQKKYAYFAFFTFWLVCSPSG
jgi:hypothetical protein